MVVLVGEIVCSSKKMQLMFMTRFLLLFLFISSSAFSTSMGQSFTLEQKTKGYAVSGDQVTFIFDESIYNVQPDRVYVTGEFRNWDGRTDSSEWDLMKAGDYWLLSINNPDFDIIRPNSAFKFRMNDGEWMAPPPEADNEQGGNLVFLKGVIGKGLKAELVHDRLIWADITGVERPLSPEAYLIRDAAGEVIPVAGVLPNESTSTLIAPSIPLDKRRVYFLEIPALKLKAHASFDGWFRTTYSTKELGANIQDGHTTIRLFAPRADLVNVYLYEKKEDDQPFRQEEMQVDEDGVWEIEIPGDLHGVYYDFTIHGPDEPGNHFYETNPVHVNDPYARVTDDTWGKGRIWRKTTPATPLSGGIPAMKDIIAYEVHVQDFTGQLPLDDRLKGTFTGMIEPGLRNSRGEKIGFDYLLDLGINVVHLMPVQEYLHYPDSDWLASFENDAYMIEQGVSKENYQWGYRTSFAMAVESRYRTRDTEPGMEREQFRDLVQAFHDQGIAVIIDIVPNHTAENMDGNTFYFNFNAIDKQYYYRTKEFEHIGAYGNEVKTENRPMTQRWLIDQCLHYIQEFGIDGFRIDLAGQIDQQTLAALKKALGDEIIVYGEAWIGSNDPDYEENPDWDWYKEDAPITFFQDDARNAFKGPVFELNSKERDRGWPGGNFDERDNVMRGLSNTFPDDKTPLSGISYLDIHDNFALADQFGTHDFDGRYAVDEQEYKIATTLLYTTLGPIVTHGGSEIMRSKASAPLREVVKETQAGYKIYMHGYRDTYNHRTANEFIWEQVGQKPRDGNVNDYANMHAFWKGMNAFRLSEYGKVFRVEDPVDEDYYQWILPEHTGMLGYIVDEKVMVLLNATGESRAFMGINVPAGEWKLIGSLDEINHEAGVDPDKDLNLTSSEEPVRIEMEPLSLFIWVKE